MAVLVEAQGEMLDSIEAQVAKARRWRKWVGGQGCAGLAGGAVYDGLVGAAAREHGLLLVSCDRRAEPTYRALGVSYELLR